MVESRRRDPSGDGEVQAGWPRKFKKKPGTLEMRFPAIWSSNFSRSSGNFAGFGNPMVYERRKKLDLRRLLF